jgi:hypothetical protein
MINGIKSTIIRISQDAELDKRIQLPPIKWRRPIDRELLAEFKEADTENLMIAGGGYPSPEETEAAWQFFKTHLKETTVNPDDLSKDNAWRFSFDSYDKMKKLVQSYGETKDPDSMVASIKAGKELPMPLAIMRRDGSLLLSGGATRTAIARLSGQPVTLLYISENEVKKWHALSIMKDLKEYADENGAWDIVESELTGEKLEDPKNVAKYFFYITSPLQRITSMIGRRPTIDEIKATSIGDK